MGAAKQGVAGFLLHSLPASTLLTATHFHSLPVSPSSQVAGLLRNGTAALRVHAHEGSKKAEKSKGGEEGFSLEADQAVAIIISKASRRCAASRPGRATPGRVPRRHLVGLPCGLRATGSQCLAGVRFARKLALASPRSRGGSVVLCQPRSHARGGGGAGSGAQAAGRDWGRLAFLTLRVVAWIKIVSSSSSSSSSGSSRSAWRIKAKNTQKRW